MTVIEIPKAGTEDQRQIAYQAAILDVLLDLEEGMFLEEIPRKQLERDALLVFIWRRYDRRRFRTSYHDDLERLVFGIGAVDRNHFGFFLTPTGIELARALRDYANARQAGGEE